MRQNLVRKLALKQQAFFDYANTKLMSMPVSVVWLLLRFVYRLRLNYYAILISFLEQTNTAWTVNSVVFVFFTILIFLLHLNYLLIALLLTALYFLGEYVSNRMSPTIFVFLFSVFLSTCFVNYYVNTFTAKFSNTFLIVLFVFLVLYNVGLLVVTAKIIKFARRIIYVCKKKHI